MAAYYTNSGDTWVTWTNSTTTTATSLSTVWYTWQESSSTATATQTWTMWTTSGTTVYTSANGAIPDTRTPEQRAAAEARWQREREEVAARAEAQRLERVAATERAKRLLESMLSVREREQYQREQFFDVIGQHSKRRYRVRQGTHGNVRLLDESGREVSSFCAQPNGVPAEDAMLAQKLMLETDERAFLHVANERRLTA